MGGGAPVAQSTVTLWAASSEAPKQLAQTKTDNEGRFEIRGADARQLTPVSIWLPLAANPEARRWRQSCYRTAGGCGQQPPASVVINEFTTLASVVTHAQFIDGAAIKGSPLQLRIAAGNVPNFVDLETGDYGATILDALNSAQTPTMANFGTLSNILAACVTRLRSDACSNLFYVRDASQRRRLRQRTRWRPLRSIVRSSPRTRPDKVFDAAQLLLSAPNAQHARQAHAAYAVSAVFDVSRPAPSSFPLKFTGGGYSGGGKLMIDSEGNAWVADNFTVGAQNQDASWTGGLTKFAPNGKPLSPSPLGFRGGGIAGPGFGLTLDAQDNAWATSFTGQNITKFDKNGKPLSPPEGWNFNRQISQMQGIIATPSGDIWTLDLIKGQVVKLPQGDPSKVQFFCQNKTGDPLKNPCKLVGPFALAIDQQDRIWVTNASRGPRGSFPRFRPQQSRNLQSGILRQRPRRRQPGQRLGDQQTGQFAQGRIEVRGRCWPHSNSTSITIPTPDKERPRCWCLP